MGYTFGGATTDDVAATVGVTAGADNRSQFIAGWWYPTTLTATRGLWSFGNVYGAEIDSTTDELRLRTDNTTDGQWTTTGVDLVVDQWKFLAFFNSTENTGVLSPWRVWAGTIDTPPALATVAVATSASGNHTGSAALAIGNKGTGSLAFQGDIADFRYVVSSATNALSTHPLAVGTSGTIDAVVEDYVFRRFVLPAWLGQPLDYRVNPAASGITEYGYWSGDLLAPIVRYGSGAATFTPLATTLNGVTVSSRRGPRPMMGIATLPLPRR